MITQNLELEDVILPPDLLVLSGDGFENPRTSEGLDDASIQELADDIVKRGLLVPLIVWLNPNLHDASYVVIDGQRRLLAIKRAIETKPYPFVDGVPCRLCRAPTLDEARTVALRTALHRRDLSSYEIAVALSKLEGTGVERAAKIGRTPAYVSKLLSALEAPPEVLEQWKAGKIGHKDAGAAASKKAPSVERPSIKDMRAKLLELYAARAKVAPDDRKLLKVTNLDGQIAILEWVVFGKPL